MDSLEIVPHGRLAQHLVETMRQYLISLKQDQQSTKNGCRASRTENQAGLTVKANIAKLSREICALTSDAEIHLLIDSLQFHFCACLKIALDLNIHEHIPINTNVAAGKLAAAVGAEKALLVRIMRVLTDKYVFSELEPGYYSHTRMSLVMCKPNEANLLRHRLGEGFLASAHLPDAIARIGYREPVRGDMVGFNLAFNTPQSLWEYMEHSDSKRGRNFAIAMAAVKMNNLEVIPQMYPFDQLIHDGGLLVDVGGGKGQVARTILASYAGLGLHCIVQDAFVDIKATSGTRRAEGGEFVVQKHNFFHEQPVKGAAAYFFRHIMHDWPDDACIVILKHTVMAMDKRRSRILICDQVMAEHKSSSPSLLYDIDMMALFGGKERTLREWENLLQRTDARLYISEIRRTDEAPTTILDVRLRF